MRQETRGGAGTAELVGGQAGQKQVQNQTGECLLRYIAYGKGASENG